jgi:hypothetical protein
MSYGIGWWRQRLLAVVTVGQQWWLMVSGGVLPDACRKTSIGSGVKPWPQHLYHSEGYALFVYPFALISRHYLYECCLAMPKCAK